jgi:hypothetical protein
MPGDGEIHDRPIVESGSTTTATAIRPMVIPAVRAVNSGVMFSGSGAIFGTHSRPDKGLNPGGTKRRRR